MQAGPASEVDLAPAVAEREHEALAARPPSPELDAAWLRAAQAWLLAFEPGVDPRHELAARIAATERATGRAGAAADHEWLALHVAFLARSTGQPQLAPPVFERVLAGSALTPLARARLLHELATLLEASGEAGEGLRACALADESLAAAGDLEPGLEAAILRTRLSCELALGLPDLAARSLAALERRAALLGPREQLNAALLDIRLRLATEDDAGALARIEVELSRPASPDVDPWIRPYLESLAGSAHSELARGRGDSAPARAHFARALGAAALRAQDRLAVLLRRAELELRLGRPAAARADLETVERLLEGSEATLEQRGLLAALDAWRSAEQPDPPADLERARARLRAVFEEWIAARAQAVRRAGGQGSLWYGNWRLVLSELVRAELDTAPGASAAERALELLFREQQARSGAGAAERPTLRETLGALARPGRGVLVLMPGMERSHAFAWEPERGVTHHPLSRRDELRTRVQELLGDLLVAPWRDPDRVGRERRLEAARAAFSAAFLPPDLALRIAGWDEVLVVGAELVLAAPLEVALLPDGRELGQHLGVSHCVSLPLAGHLSAQDAAPRDPTVLVAVAPQPAPEARRLLGDLEPIPFGGRERAAWERAAAPWRLLDVSARASTPAGLREVGAAATTLLIVVAHGVYDASQEFPAGLALAGGILRREHILAQGAAWPPEVLLLACGSARGVARFGDDTATHLGAQFLAGGARCVLVSRGDLELSASSVLVEELLRERARGLDVGRAAAAGRRALAARPETRDLFHRGLVALHGVIPRVTPARLADPLTARADIEPAERGALALDRASLLVVVLVLGALAAGAAAWVRARARRA